MNIIAYLNKSDDRVFPKDLVQVREITGTMRGSFDYLNPNFTLETTFPLDFDYIYVQELNRYYYVTDTLAPNTPFVNVQCTCDVLQTFYPQFIQSQCIVGRNKEMWNAYIKDERRQFYQYSNNQYVTLGNIGMPDSPVLICV